MSTARFLVAVSVLIVGVAGHVEAEPLLQIYLEGGTYNHETESWDLTPEGSSGGAPFRLWAIGNVAGPGGKGTIGSVRVSFAYDAGYEPLPQLLLIPSTTGGDYGYVTDPSTPVAPEFLQRVTNGSSPVLDGGKPLPAHGIYGPGTVWQEFLLGDFTLTDSPIGDFIGEFPTSFTESAGQINVYDVYVNEGHGATVHVDLYNHIEGANHGKFAPFSHDGDGDVHVIPAPSTLVGLVTMAATGLFIAWRRRLKRS